MKQYLKNICQKSWFKCGLSFAGIGLIFFSLLMSYANDAVSRCGCKVYSSINDVPVCQYGLLLGTAKIVQEKYLNQYFQYRIAAAVQLYHAGKIRKIIVSGDNRRKEYNEPKDMQNALMELGVKAEDILLDYAGFRTLDSVVRARNVFHADTFLIISQKYHCERAIYLARAHGINATGYAAQEVSPRFRFKRFFREPISRLLAWLDVNVLHRKPHFER